MKKNYKAIVAKIIGALLPLVIMGCSPDYVDEYGINHGKGIEIDGVVWAPVNCGYHATDYPWGKLYQWGRKCGQGYDGDATTPTLVKGPVSLEVGSSANNSNVYYWDSSDWISLHDGTLWNSGPEDAPIKTEYDPCPDGWRVPTYKELRVLTVSALTQNRSDWTKRDLNQSGVWFSGSKSYSETSPRVFFPAAGFRGSDYGDARSRDVVGYYWSSEPDDGGRAFGLDFGVGDDVASMFCNCRATGYSVRCVQD